MKSIFLRKVSGTRGKSILRGEEEEGIWGVELNKDSVILATLKKTKSVVTEVSMTPFLT